MKLKKLLMILGIVGVLALSPFCKAHAYWTWYTCNVIAVEAAPAQVWIQLTETNGAFSSTWFMLDQAQADRMLAMSMFAMANSKQVQIWTTDSQSSTIVQYMMLLN